MSQLENRYDNKYVIGAAFHLKLNEWPWISDRDNLGLRRLADFSKQCLAAKQVYNSLDILDGESEYMKLPDRLLSQWTRGVNESKIRDIEFPLFQKFTEFLVFESDLASDSVKSDKSIVVAMFTYRNTTSTDNNGHTSRVHNRHNSTVHDIHR